MNILVFTTLWPNSEQPNFGVFVKHRVAALSRLPGVNVRVIAPVPYFPKQFDASFIPAHWRRTTRIAERTTIDGLDTFHPRYLCTPKVGMSFYGRWMARGALDVVRRLHAERPFDLIDAHYVFPDGEAAVRIGAALNIPVAVTARGTDINLFTQMPLIRPRVQRVLERANGVIAVSAALKQRMMELGVASAKIAVIRNGVDTSIFYPRERAAARRKLQLADDAQIIVSVCALVPLKGVARLLSAMRLIVTRNTDSRARLYVIGEGPERAALTAYINAHGLQGCVLLVGARPQAELAEWYAAADLFCLASTREGCPNVVIEAQACGAPVVASDVGGVRELLASEDCGRLVPAGLSASETAEAFATQIEAALAREWERARIAAHAGARTWADVARELEHYYAANCIGANQAMANSVYWRSSGS